MPARRWRDTLTWAGPLAMALFGGIALLAGDSGAASAGVPTPQAASASVGAGAGNASPAPRTLAEAQARHRALRSRCEQHPVAAVRAECLRIADRQLAHDRARRLPHAGASDASAASRPRLP